MSVPGTDDDGPISTPVAVLRETLESARQAGFLGPGPIERHLHHAEGFVALARAHTDAESARVLDLGSGGGLPGLVLAAEWPTVDLVLLEANERRAQFLDRAVMACRFEDHVQVVHQRAELAGRSPLLRAAFDGVVVRSFGPPAVVAECAAPFLRVGGWLIVSEPPSDLTGDSDEGGPIEVDSAHAGDRAEPPRWPAQGLAEFGLEPVDHVRDGFGYQVMRQIELCPERFPRRNGVPAKKPLF